MIIKPKIISGGEDVGSGSLLIRFHYLAIENGELVNKIAERYCNVGDTVTPPTISTSLDAVTKQSCALTFKEWNYTNVQLTNIQTDIDVGAIYNTSDSKTHAFVTVNAGTGYNLPVYFNKSDSSTLTISWGDGTTDYTTTDSGDITTTHTYSTAGIYEITIWISSGNGTFIFGYNGGSLTCFIGGTNQAYRNCLNSIFMDGNIRNSNLSGAFNSAKNLKFVTLSTYITNLYTNSFRSCYNLQYISLPTSVLTIEGSNFRESNLTFISIPLSVTTIYNFNFQECDSLEKIIIPSSVTNFYNQECYNCYSLKQVVVNANITTLSSSIFGYCRYLTEVELSNTVQDLNNGVFDNLSGTKVIFTLKRFTAPSTITTLSNTNVFNTINNQTRIYVPVGSETVYKTATNWSTYANYIYEDNPTNRALFGD